MKGREEERKIQKKEWKKGKEEMERKKTNVFM